MSLAFDGVTLLDPLKNIEKDFMFNEESSIIIR